MFANDGSMLAGLFAPAFIFSTPVFIVTEAPFCPVAAAFDGASSVAALDAVRVIAFTEATFGAAAIAFGAATVFGAEAGFDAAVVSDAEAAFDATAGFGTVAGFVAAASFSAEANFSFQSPSRVSPPAEHRHLLSSSLQPPY
jgi:hypothetical protein